MMTKVYIVAILAVVIVLLAYQLEKQIRIRGEERDVPCMFYIGGVIFAVIILILAILIKQ